MARRRKKAFGTKSKVVEAAQVATLLRYYTSSLQGGTHDPLSLGSSACAIFDVSEAQVLTADSNVVRGDLMIAGSGNDWERLSLGPVDQVLHSDGTDTAWRDLFDAVTPAPVGAAGATGSASAAARRDHVHAAGTGIPGNIEPDDTAAEGTSGSMARSDHTHGITAAAPTVAISASTTNTEGTATSFLRSDHTHLALTTSDGETTPDRILQTDGAGYLRVKRLGAGAYPATALQAYSTSEQLRLNYDAGGYASFTVADGGTLSIATATDNSTGNLTLEPAGDVLIDPTGDDVLPVVTFDINLGSFNKKYLTLHCAELWVDTLVAASTMATIGGRILVAPTDTLAASMTTGTTTMTTRYDEMAPNDIILFEDRARIEFMKVTAGPAGGASPYSYTVTRNLDGSGANEWYAGDAVVNTGVADEGFIDIYSVHGVKAGTEYGPTLVGNIRGSSTYNDWTEHWALGNLNGLYGVSSNVYGVALGEYAASRSHITIDGTNGIQIKHETATVVGQWDTDGNIRVGRTGTGENNVYIDSDGELQLRTDTTWKMKLTADGALLIDPYGDMFFSDADGLLLMDFQKITGGGSEGWWVHATREEKAELTGAIHQEAGRWQGTRALVVEEGTTNRLTNPRMYDSNDNGNSDSWVFWDDLGSGGAPTATVVDHPNTAKGWLQRIQYTGVSGDSDDMINFYLDTTAASFSAGDAATFSVAIKGESSGVTINLLIIAKDSGDVTLGGTSSAITGDILESTLKRFSVTYSNLPASTNYVRCEVQIDDVDNGDSADIYVGEAQCEKLDHATSWCHGFMGEGYAWTGTEDSSTSTRTATDVDLSDYADLLFDQDTVSVRIVAQMPYDSDATWPVNVYILDAYVDSSNRILFRYDDANDYFRVYLNGAYRFNSSAQTFKAGDQMDFVLTLDFTSDEYYLYINGVEDGSDTTSLTTPTGDASWRIGCMNDGTSSWANMAFSELAVFGRILDPDEVTALYTMQRPLVDSGAVDKPGIFILDGEFRLSSALTNERVEMFPHGIGIFGGTGASGVGRLLGGFVDSGSAILHSGASDLGWFGYDDNDELQAAWYAAGASKGKIVGGAGDVYMDASGLNFVIGSGGYAPTNAVKWMDGSTMRSRIYGYDLGAANYLQVESAEVSGHQSYMELRCDSDTGYDAYIDLRAQAGDNDYTILRLLADDDEDQHYLHLMDGSFLVDELAASPAGPQSGTECRLYMRDDKFILQYNDGGTVRYKYLDLTGTGVTWTHTTTAP